MKIAAFVSIHNDIEFMWHFLEYYTHAVDHVFVFDNETTDGSIELCGDYSNVSVESYYTGKLDDAEKLAVYQRKREAVKDEYRYVLFLDSDEFVMSRHRPTLREGIEARDGQPIMGTQGWNMYEYPDDPPYDPRKSLFSQRKKGIRNDHYSKPIIIRSDVAADFVVGCHSIKHTYHPQGGDPEDAKFLLIHYRGCNDELFIRRSLTRTRRLDKVYANYYWGGSKESFQKKLDYEKWAQPWTKILP